MTYELRYGRAGVVHITGLPEATKTSTDGMTYAQSACPALSRANFYTKTVRLASFEDPRSALQRTKEFGSSHSLCKRCEAAAKRVIEDIRKNSQHNDDLVPLKDFVWTGDYSYHRSLTCVNHPDARFFTKNPWDRSIHNGNDTAQECKCPGMDDLRVIVSKSQAPVR